MNRTSVRMAVGILLLACLLAPGTVLAKGPGPDGLLAANLNVTLEPGISHGWAIGPSSVCGAYVVEATPRGHAMQGAYVEAFVRPEYDGRGWNDVLRAQIPADHPPLKVNLRAYRICQLEVVWESEETLYAGEWMGWVVGPASTDRGLIVEVTPLDPSFEGATIEKALVQEEFFMGEWQDVLRVQMSVGAPEQRAHLRVYATGRLPVLAEYELNLEPGVWTGVRLQRSTGQGGYVVEINPRSTPAAGEFVEQLRVQPEFDGKHWNDVLRLQTPIDQPPLSVQARVYGLGKAPHGK